MCPKMVDKQAKRQDILEAAMKVFARKGVAHTKMADVAEAAGIGKGTIYEYFRSKDDIFAEAFRHFMERADEVIAKRLFKIYDPIEKLAALIAGWVEVMQDTSIDFMEIMIDFWAEGVQHDQKPTAFDLKKAYNDNRRMIVEILEEGISKGRLRPMNTTIVASILIGALDGLGLQWMMDHSLFKLDEAADVLTKSFVEGLKKDV